MPVGRVSFGVVFSRKSRTYPFLEETRQGIVSLFLVLSSLLAIDRKVVPVMQEDVLGTRRTAISETYVTCARCGKATRLRHARIIQSDALSESKSDFEYLCPECQKALANGEKDLPLSE